MKLSKLIVGALLVALSSHAFAQYDAIDKDYYVFPIQPEKDNFLSGNMGELRSSHFHAGLDIKTNGVEGLSVLASADGYVSRIRVGTGGYGNCIYIQHPNGTSTVYAHLRNFSEAIAEYTLKEQYRRKSFEVNLFPKKGEFTVKKGEVIGFSGNSGSSTGPHLHFEIRGVNHEVLDPLRIGFNQIKDNIPPKIETLALKTNNIQSRVNQQFGRFEFDLQSKNSRGLHTDTIYALGQIGMEIFTYDQLNGASNRNGVPLIDVYVNDELYFQQNIDSINFSLQKNILIHTNYQAAKETRKRFNKLYVDDGNPLKFYPKKKNNGYLLVEANAIKNVRIEARDAYGNKSTVQFVIKGLRTIECLSDPIKVKYNSYTLDNTLMLFQSRDSINNKITVYNQQGSKVYEPAYYNDQQNVYLIDLRKVLPLEVVYRDGSHQEIAYSDRVPAASEHSFLADTYSLKFSKSTLFDTLYFRAKHYVDEKTGKDVFEFSEDIYPLKGGIEVEMELLGSYDSLSQYRLYMVDGSGNAGFVGGTIKDGKARFTMHGFGKYTLLKDLEPPTIRKRSVQNNIISLTIDDKLSGINNFEAKLNGEWLLMHYEPKKKLIWSEMLHKNKPLKGEFELKVADNAGNESILKLNIE
ncbi:M23 family metallopeptidase [Roseivirga sp. UBA838]|uniref:M23 family metallopeptidase n=1 Tax=Roseivirga sp. UBA838 TaxID=1947393 RepID=UPI00257ED4F4|nr:M23 family metallopeptidase [Roseivirga sp. UBA838]